MIKKPNSHNHNDDDNIITSRLFREDPPTISTLRRKGSGALSTEKRRFTWDFVVWPMLQHLDRPYFTLEEYQYKRNEFCKFNNIPVSKLSGGLVSLIIKDILKKDYEHKTWIYSIHYRLIPYMRKKIRLEYGLAVRESSGKR